MKYFLVFLIVCVALAAASPQFIAAWPGAWPGAWPASRTVVAGPTVVNEGAARLIAPGWPAFI